MSFHLDRVHVWACEVPDEAGGVANKLHALAEAGANCNTSVRVANPTARAPASCNIAPVTGPETTLAAKAVGLREVFSPVIVRVEGDNQSGLAARLTKEWALADISFTGLTMTVLGPVGYADSTTPSTPTRPPRILPQIGTEAKAKEMSVKEPAMAERATHTRHRRVF